MMRKNNRFVSSIANSIVNYFFLSPQWTLWHRRWLSFGIDEHKKAEQINTCAHRYIAWYGRRRNFMLIECLNRLNCLAKILSEHLSTAGAMNIAWCPFYWNEFHFSFFTRFCFSTKQNPSKIQKIQSRSRFEIIFYPSSTKYTFCLGSNDWWSSLCKRLQHFICFWTWFLNRNKE